MRSLNSRAGELERRTMPPAPPRKVALIAEDHPVPADADFVIELVGGGASHA